MPRSPSERVVFRRLSSVWRSEHPDDPEVPVRLRDFAEGWIEEALEGRTLQHVDELAVDGEHWVLAIADAKAHLLRLREPGLELVFLGSLLGGQYRETISEGIKMEFDHPALRGTTLVIEGGDDRKVVSDIRAVLREWGEAPPQATGTRPRVMPMA